MNYFIKNSDAQTIAEEWANAVVHGMGVLLSIAALVTMVINSERLGNLRAMVSCSVFGATLILLYLTSTLYHAVWHNRAKLILQICDHMMIYLLIAGSYTPFMLVGLGGGWGWSIFGVVWGLALAGLIFKLFFTGRLEKLSIGIYIGMGWLAIIAIKPIYHALPLDGILWLVAGGCAYTLGTLFYAYDRIRFAHAIWHMFVLLGSACHVIAVLFYVLPKH